MSDRFYDMLGLCRRAGHLVCGEDKSISTIRSDKACLALLDRGASDNAKKLLTNACTYRNIRLIETETDRLGQAVGHRGCKMCVVTDKGFAEALISRSEN